MTDNTATGIIHLPQTSGNWWMILDVGPGWFLLYEHWMQRQAQGRWVRDRNQKLQFQNTRLMRPVWGNHISMIRGEEPLENAEAWENFDGMELRFRFDPAPQFNETGPRFYWWLDIECPEIGDIRESFGLDREPEYPLHLTLGTLR